MEREGEERNTIRGGINEREREYRIYSLCAFCEDETLKSHLEKKIWGASCRLQYVQPQAAPLRETSCSD